MTRFWIVVAAGLFACLVSIQPADSGRGELLSQGVVAKSRTGRFRLDVAPDAQRVQVARYRVRREGHTVWTGERQFTLSGAAITEDGVVAGYANGGYGFLVVVLDAEGKERWRHSVTRMPSRVPDGPAMPFGVDVSIAEEPERLVMRVLDDLSHAGVESLWMHPLDATGKWDRFQLRLPPEFKDQTGELLKVRAVPGSPLLLAQWMTRRRLSPLIGEVGAYFALFDSSLRVVWSHYLPHDYRKASEWQSGEQLIREVRRQSALLPPTADREFILRFANENQAVTFRVEQRGEEWEVREQRRRPYTGRAPKER